MESKGKLHGYTCNPIAYVILLKKSLFRRKILDSSFRFLTKPWANFINFLPAAFALADPKSAKKTDNLTVFFVPLGSAHLKVAHRTFMKLTP